MPCCVVICNTQKKRDENDCCSLVCAVVLRQMCLFILPTRFFCLCTIIICLFLVEWPLAIFMMLYAPNGFNFEQQPFKSPPGLLWLLFLHLLPKFSYCFPFDFKSREIEKLEGLVKIDALFCPNISQ